MLRCEAELFGSDVGQMKLFCISSSARQLAKTRGVGQIRDMDDLKVLLLPQSIIQDNIVGICRLSDEKNPADILTKGIGRGVLDWYHDIVLKPLAIVAASSASARSPHSVKSAIVRC